MTSISRCAGVNLVDSEALCGGVPLCKCSGAAKYCDAQLAKVHLREVILLVSIYGNFLQWV